MRSKEIISCVRSSHYITHVSSYVAVTIFGPSTCRANLWWLLVVPKCSFRTETCDKIVTDCCGRLTLWSKCRLKNRCVASIDVLAVLVGDFRILNHFKPTSAVVVS